MRRKYITIEFFNSQEDLLTKSVYNLEYHEKDMLFSHFLTRLRHKPKGMLWNIRPARYYHEFMKYVVSHQ